MGVKPLQSCLALAVAASSACIESTPGYSDASGSGNASGVTSGTSGPTGAAPTTATSDTAGPDVGSGDTGGSTSVATDSASGNQTGSGSTGASTSGSTAPETTTSMTGTGSDHVLFVTSTIYDGALGGLAGADAICQERADAAGLAGTFVALLSTSAVDARDRVAINGPVRDTIGEVIATGAADLWDGMLAKPVEHDESGGPRNTVTWTGSTADGSSSGSDCLGWTSNDNDDYGTQGVQVMAATWFAGSPDRCFKVKSLYCIET